MEELLKNLEKEIFDLKLRNAELKQLSKSDDHIHFLQSFQHLAVLPESTDVHITTKSLFSFEDLRKSVFLLREKIEYFYKEHMEKITREVSDLQIIPAPDLQVIPAPDLQVIPAPDLQIIPAPDLQVIPAPDLQIIPAPDLQTRDEFIKYFHQFTLDPNTATKNLRLSEESRAVTNTGINQNHPAHPDRFEWPQVLCKECVSDRCYWEFEWSGRAVAVSVSYKTISSEGLNSLFGYNNESWRLICTSFSCSFSHNKNHTELPVRGCSRIGVYVNHRAGILSFYNVSNTMTLIHRVHTTFTQPLYPGFLVWFRSTVKLCEFGQIR